MKLNFVDHVEETPGVLPTFSAPPVVEVTCGIQFEELAGYHNLMLADFRKILEKEYPAVSEHPALPPTFETFGGSENQISQPQFELVNTPVPSRFWLISEDGANLIQIQQDRFHFNWRQASPAQSYPRYEAIREPFKHALDQFIQWTKETGLGSIKPTQSEVVYVNRIPFNLGTSKPCGLSDIFQWFAGLEGRTENGSFKFNRKLIDSESKDSPVGRFYFELDYGTGPDGNREAILKLTVRGRPIETGIEAHLEFIDQGRAIIVQQFARVTSAKARQHWKEE